MLSAKTMGWAFCRWIVTGLWVGLLATNVAAAKPKRADFNLHLPHVPGELIVKWKVPHKQLGAG